MQAEDFNCNRCKRPLIEIDPLRQWRKITITEEWEKEGASEAKRLAIGCST
jgi:hypothetical protein